MVSFNGVLINEANIIADNLNRYFIDSIEKIVNDIGCDNNNSNILLEDDTVNEWSEFQETSYIKLNSIINKLDANKGTRNEINSEIIKLVWKANKNLILYMINNSLKLGTVPNAWKTSIITPIQKVKDTCKAEELRPINTLPIYEQLLEHVVKEQLEKFIEENHILNQEQSGFRKKYSCETALQHSFIEWRVDLNKGLYIGVLFIDFPRAFETIDRFKLLQKLQSLGIQGTVFEWFKSYLIDRKQKVKFKNIFSKSQEIKYGVPQGSKLGPLLFIIYINDVVERLKKSNVKCKLFADDMKIYYSSKYLITIESKLNESLKILSDWLKEFQLKININKTHYMILHDKRAQNIRGKCDIKYNDVILNEVKETKYLGVILDDNLTFNENAIFTSKKISQKVNILYRLNNSVSSFTKCMIYKTIIAPHFNYCSTVMINYDDNKINILQKMQNRAIRNILLVNKYTSIKLMLETLGWLSIRQQIIYNTCIFIYKMINKLTPSYLSELIQYNSERCRYKTRNQKLLNIDFTKTHTAEKTIIYKGYNWYNKLPPNVRNEKSLISFKRELKDHIKLCIDV